MADLFGVRIAAASIARISRSCTARLQDFVVAARDGIAAAAGKHMDETGFRTTGVAMSRLGGTSPLSTRSGAIP
jgi:transposase